MSSGQLLFYGCSTSSQVALFVAAMLVVTKQCYPCKLRPCTAGDALVRQHASSLACPCCVVLTATCSSTPGCCDVQAWLGLQDELAVDMQRLWQRNLGRDDRLVADISRCC